MHILKMATQGLDLEFVDGIYDIFCRTLNCCILDLISQNTLIKRYYLFQAKQNIGKIYQSLLLIFFKIAFRGRDTRLEVVGTW